MSQYLNQAHRGQLGFGIMSLGSTKTTIIKTPDQTEIIEALFRHDSKDLIFHHRQPTSTSNSKESAHPFSVTINDRIYHTIHNGMIYNYQELYEKMKQTYSFESEEIDRFTKKNNINDSEVLAIDLAEILSGNKPGIESNGWFSFITLITDTNSKPLEVVYGRHQAPLLMVYQPTSLWLASEGEGIEIEQNLLYRYNLKTRQLTTDANAVWPKIELPSFNGSLNGTDSWNIPQISRKLQRKIDIAEWDYEQYPTQENLNRLNRLYDELDQEALELSGE